MSYRPTVPGERGLQAVGQLNIPGGWPGFPGMLPGPIAPHPGPIGPNVPGGLFPTHTRVGDVVNVTGPFGGFGQGQVRVRFQGSGWMYPQIMGPTMASVVVPEGAENGLCEVELNGRRIFGANCIIDKGTERVGKPSHAARDTSSWAGGELVRVAGVAKESQMNKNGSYVIVNGRIEPLEGYLGAMPATLVRTTLLLSAASYATKQLNDQFNSGASKDDVKMYATWGHWGFMAIAVLGALGVIHD